MKPFEFPEFPSSASVSSAVTVLVAGWFVLASGAILTDQHSEGTLEMARTPSSLGSTSSAKAGLRMILGPVRRHG